MNIHILRLAAGGAILFVLGWGAAITWRKKHMPEISLIRENPSEYRLINPILIIENSALTFDEYKPLQEKIEAQIRADESGDAATSVSVYFRDLNSSKWTGVNEDEPYAPSSMIKLVTLVAYLGLAQEDPDLLQQKLYFANRKDAGQHYKPPLLPPGNYSVRELLSHMIVDSDNDAMNLLNKQKSGKFLEVYQELGLPKPLSQTSDDFMSAEMYSRLFRTLYSSTYLARPYSEEALKLLSQTTFTKGLVAGVPAGTAVAHKFGEHTIVGSQGVAYERQLHDCGIVYYPGHPYFLCVMTKGVDFTKLESVISSLSKLVYEEASNLK